MLTETGFWGRLKAASLQFSGEPAVESDLRQNGRHLVMVGVTHTMASMTMKVQDRIACLSLRLFTKAGERQDRTAARGCSDVIADVRM